MVTIGEGRTALMFNNTTSCQIDILSLGELVMDMYPRLPGARSGIPDDFTPEPGGANANVAVATSKLGARSAFIGKIGSDPHGEALTRVLNKNGVKTNGLCVDSIHPTTQVFLTPSEGSPKRYKFNRVGGADLFLQQDDLDLDMIRSAAVLHLTSLMLVSEPTRSTQLKAIEVARESGGLISFDVNHRPGLWPDKTEALFHIRSMVRNCDILKVNETELEILTGTRDPGKGMSVLLAEGVNLVAVTLGEKGCHFATLDTCGYIPAYKVSGMDPLGCGDAFTAAMLVKILEAKKTISNLLNTDLVGIFRFANAAGALTSTGQGAISSFPERPAVDELISRSQH